MPKRFAAIWFRHLLADWHVRKQPGLQDKPFVLATPRRGRMIVTASSPAAQGRGIEAGMALADCRALQPSLQVFNESPGQSGKLLDALAEWCLRYTPVVAPDQPEGLLLDISGCAHLWNGELAYLESISSRLRAFGYSIRAAIADTAGTAWAVSRYGPAGAIIETGRQAEALMPLPPAALRLEAPVIEKLQKLGLYQIQAFMGMPRSALRRRFGATLLRRLDQALGAEDEQLEIIQPGQPFQERLPCLEPIRSATGIEIALQRLLEVLCTRLEAAGKGLRQCTLHAYRMDGEQQQINIGTNRPTRNAEHIFRLLAQKIDQLEPDLGFELFMLEAPHTEELTPLQEMLWNTAGTGDEPAVAEMLDRLANRVGIQAIHRYLPDEHYWPERSFRRARSLTEEPGTEWRTSHPRPVHLLPRPELIEVSVPLPDYPPALFRYRGKLYTVHKADGPERIEQEWWLQVGDYRDYYCVEDSNGMRYWVFRLGSYENNTPTWFLHGFFA
jgi:protein ImuB